MSSILSFISSNIVPILIGAIGLLMGYVGVRVGVSARQNSKTIQKAEKKATESRETTSQKVSEVHKQKEQDLANVSKDGKERVKKANEKIKDFNSKI